MTTALIIMVWVLVAGFFAGTEIGAYRLNRVRLRHQVESGALLSRMLQHVVRHMERFVCMTLVAHNAAVYAASAVFTGVLLRRFEDAEGAEFAGTLVLAPVLLLFAEVLPKSIFHILPNRIMRWAAPVLWLTDTALYPISKLLLGVIGLWRRLVGASAAQGAQAFGAQHLHFLFEEGKSEGVITPQQDVMVKSILNLGNRQVRQSMVPLSHVRMVSVDAGRDEVTRTLKRHDHPRLPVYEGRRDNVVGILICLDYLGHEPMEPVATLMHEPTFLPHNARVDHAFRRMQRDGHTMAIVVDQRQRAIGIVTVDDLLQQMFISIS